MLLSLVNLFVWLSYNLITPIMAEYAMSIGTSLSTAGVIAGLFALSSLLVRPFSGLLSDRCNRKRLNLVVVGVMAGALAVYAVVDVVWVLFVFRVIHGVAFGISSTACLAIVSDVVPEDLLSEGVNYYGLGQILAAAVGPGLGIWISGRFGYSACLCCGALLLLAAAIAAGAIPAKARPDLRDRKTARGSGFFEKKVLMLAVVYGSHTIVNGVVSTYLVALANSRGIAGVNGHFMVNAGVLFLVRMSLSKWMNRVGLGPKLYLAGACFGAAVLLISQAKGLWPLLLAGVCKAVGQGIGMPTVQTEALKAVLPERRGVAGSTVYIGGDLGQTIGSVGGGALSEQVGYGGTFLLAAVPLAVAAGLFALLHRQQVDKTENEEEIP